MAAGQVSDTVQRAAREDYLFMMYWSLTVQSDLSQNRTVWTLPTSWRFTEIQRVAGERPSGVSADTSSYPFKLTGPDDTVKKNKSGKGKKVVDATSMSVLDSAGVIYRHGSFMFLKHLDSA